MKEEFEQKSITISDTENENMELKKIHQKAREAGTGWATHK